ncbi:MAG: hypothetical protein LC777_10445 [Actinobacteria bacterium]|nr:hypothetical protein [Actinomycetota bacterium]
MLLLALVALVASGTAIVWLAGLLASLLSESGSLALGPAEAVQVLRRLPGTIGDPANAWPAAVRGELPGPTMLIALLVVAALVIGL